MNLLLDIARGATPILQSIFIIIVGLGYYFSVRATRNVVEEMRGEHQAGGGRPLITVSEDYATLPNLNILVKNSGGGPAKNISFEFSSPIESSDGLITISKGTADADGGTTAGRRLP